MKNKYSKGIVTLLAIMALSVPTKSNAQKYVGGDISTLPTKEKKTLTYKDAAGNSVSNPIERF